MLIAFAMTEALRAKIICQNMKFYRYKDHSVTFLVIYHLQLKADMSRVMRKPAYCMYENKGADVSAS